eukprot:366146-Chlamydomonas_euryale.AAC.2
MPFAAPATPFAQHPSRPCNSPRARATALAPAQHPSRPRNTPGARATPHAQYPDRVVSDVSGTVEHTVKADHPSSSGFYQACAEVWAFSLTDYQIITLKSGFGKVGAMLAAPDHPHIFTVNFPMQLFDALGAGGPAFDNRKVLTPWQRTRSCRVADADDPAEDVEAHALVLGCRCGRPGEGVLQLHRLLALPPVFFSWEHARYCMGRGGLVCAAGGVHANEACSCQQHLLTACYTTPGIFPHRRIRRSATSNP